MWSVLYIKKGWNNQQLFFFFACASFCGFEMSSNLQTSLWSYLISPVFDLFLIFCWFVQEMNSSSFSKSVNSLSLACVVDGNWVFSVLSGRIGRCFFSAFKEERDKLFLIWFLNLSSPAFLWEEEKYFIIKLLEENA